ncbi:hypothetical protein PLICRDRAFT_129672 [Plicaturopsis crispa FD-325 SS-3]|nr:hypothetical protein PLICRDRAFT_129672 [Plicaturopsis crispa FD-325 SS-3]
MSDNLPTLKPEALTPDTVASHTFDASTCSDEIPPKHADVLVIGGGPAGSYAAAALAREGVSVVVLESAKFPRYHVGESLIPSVRHYLRFIGAEEAVEKWGFVRKPGSAIKFNQFKREGYTDFVALGHDNNAWNVVRSEFDHLLLKHARKEGAAVWEETRVLAIQFEGKDDKKPHSTESATTLDVRGLSLTRDDPVLDPKTTTDSADSAMAQERAQETGSDGEKRGEELGRPVSVTWSRTVRTSALDATTTDATDSANEGVKDTTRTITGTTSFTHLIDASGRAGLMSTRYLRSRVFSTSLRNVAVWGYWKGAGVYGINTVAKDDEDGGEHNEQKEGDESKDDDKPQKDRVGAPWFEALTDESGWAWFIPLHDGTVSVGVVLAHTAFAAARAAHTHAPAQPSPTPAANADTKRSRSASIASLLSQFIPSFSTPATPSTPSPPTSAFSSVWSSPLSSASTAPSPPPSPARSRADALQETYRALLPLAPGVVRLIGSGTLVGKVVQADAGEEDAMTGNGVRAAGDARRGGVSVDKEEGEVPLVRSASDFSYSAPEYAGAGYRIVGDAGSFIDPFFSSGIHLAMTSALSAAASICAARRGDCSESAAAEWHTRRVATSYTRFQVVVLSAYKQIRAQSTNVLSDIDEDNFDRAFSFLRPVIQGAGDMGTTLSENELQKSLDFCVDLFSPTTPAQHARAVASTSIPRPLLDVNAPLVNLGSAFSADRGTEAETEMVLKKINARKVVHKEYAINNFETEPMEGLVVRLVRGHLGLVRAK